MADELSHWIHACRGRRVLLVGDLILDRYIYGDAERISPEAPVPVLRAVESRDAVGGSANVAACLRALECEVASCGVIGADDHGRRLRSLLTELGVDVSCVVEQTDRPTTTKTRLVGLAQHRHRQQLLRLDEEDTTPIDEKTASGLRDAVLARIATSDIVCIEDYDKGLIGNELAAAIITEAKSHQVPVLVDPARLQDYSRYQGATIITPNRDELCVAVGKRCPRVEDVAESAKQLVQRYALTGVVVTVDRDGAVVVSQMGNWQHLPTVPRSVYDNTGAGDAVLAMLAAAIASGADLVSAARLANIAGGLEVEKFGCVPILADEILAELRLKDRDENGKLRGEEELLTELQLRRDRGETVAFTNGCFDILHAGHVDLLKKCRKEASVLVVGLNSDDSVRALKGVERPIHRFEHRAAVLGALECVDYVIGFADQTPERLIQSIKPDVLVKGADWANKGVVGREFVEACGGRVITVPIIEGLSTTAAADRLRGAGATAKS